MTAANSLPSGVPGVSSAGTPAEPKSGSHRPVAMDAGGADRYYLWEGPRRQSGPYTHAELLALIKREKAVRPPPIVRYVVKVTADQLDILDSLRSCDLTTRQLAEDTGRRAESVRLLLLALARMRLVTKSERSTYHPYIWSLTPRGRQALDQLDPGAP